MGRANPHDAEEGWGRAQGFTLVELIVVMGIIVVLTTLAIPAFQTIKGSNSFATSTYEIASVIEQGRTYAMANHTYVFIGIVETDASNASSMTPQVKASSSAGGRVAVMVFAARDAMRGYDLNDPASSWTTNYSQADDGSAKSPGFRLNALTKLMVYENLHLTVLQNPGTGPMHRPDVSTDPTADYMVAHDNCKSVTPITYRLGSPMTNGQYSFEKVIVFSPQGVARIQFAATGDAVDRCIEIGLQPTHGNAVPAAPAANQGQQAAIQVDCATGAVRIYRP